jgi:putative SOS response-associated peptidase YedK
MCNEYRNRQSLDRLAEAFGQAHVPLHWAGGAPNLEPRDSIRPTDPAPIVLGDGAGGGALKQLHWGFVQPGRPPVINFRSEGRRFPVGRCLIPADGFYEFTGAKYPKSKWLFTPTEGSDLSGRELFGGELFAIAGLARDDRFTMLTCEPGPDIAPDHNRQIVILPKDQWAAWLGPAEAQPPVGPLPAGSLKVEKIR